uniref:Autophagy-related protein 2 n=1 Tax=Dunaliella tertiolecta TaxID=3047 RepID=A0A7S3VSR0_DUNTE
MQQQQQQQQQGWHGRLSGGGLGVQWAGRSGPRRDGMPRPLLRVLLKGMSGTWIMHMPSPASSSSVAPASEPHAQPLQCPQVAPTQPGEKCVEVQAEGVSVLMETYPQGGIPARRLRLNVHTFEVRECHPHPFATDSSLLHLIPHPLNGSPTRYTHQPPSHLSHRSSSSTSKGRAPPDFTAAPGLNPIRHSSATTAHLPGLHAAKTSSNLPSAANRALMGHRVGGALAAAAAGLLPGYRGGSTTRKRRSQGVKVLSYRAYKGRQRDSRACMLSLLLDWVRPSPRSHPETEELRLQVSLLPIHLHLDQDLLQSFRGLAAAAADPPTRAALHLLSALQLEAQGGESAPVLPFFQHVEISAARLTIDYRPRRIDVAALRDGSIMELVNLVPLGGLSLSLCPLRLAGMEGWDGLGARVAKEWCSHVARTQAHKFLTGLAPVHAVLSAGEAVTATLMAAPSSSLGRQLARGAAAVAAGASRSAVPMMAGLRAWRESAAAAQMRESVSHVARSVVQEALARGSSVAAAAAAGGVGGAAAPQWPMLAGASSAPPLAQSAADVMGQVSDTFGTTRPGQAADAEQRKDGIVGNSSTSSSRDAHGVNPFGGSKPLQAGISTVGRKSKSLLPKMWRKASASVVRKSFGQPLSPSSSSPSPGTFSPAHARQPMCPAGSEEEVPAQQPSNRSGSRSPVCEGGNHAGQAGRIGAACVVASGGRTLEPLPHWTHPAAFPQQQSCSQDAAVVLLDEWELLEGRASEAGATPPQQQLEDQVQERTMEHNGRVETLQHSSVESSASMEDRGAKVGGGGTAHLSGVEGCFPWTLSSVGEGQTAVKSCSRGSSSSSSSSSSTSGACDVCVDALDLPDLDDL